MLACFMFVIVSLSLLSVLLFAFPAACLSQFQNRHYDDRAYVGYRHSVFNAVDNQTLSTRTHLKLYRLYQMTVILSRNKREDASFLKTRHVTDDRVQLSSSLIPVLQLQNASPTTGRFRTGACASTPTRHSLAVTDITLGVGVFTDITLEVGVVTDIMLGVGVVT